MTKSCQSACSALQGTGRHAAGRYCISKLFCLTPSFSGATALTTESIGVSNPLKNIYRHYLQYLSRFEHSPQHLTVFCFVLFFLFFYYPSSVGPELRSDHLRMNCPSLSLLSWCLESLVLGVLLPLSVQFCNLVRTNLKYEIRLKYQKSGVSFLKEWLEFWNTSITSLFS